MPAEAVPGEPLKYLVDRILRKNIADSPAMRRKTGIAAFVGGDTQQKTIYGFKRTFCGKTYQILSETSIGVRKLLFPLDVDINHDNQVSSDDRR